MRKFVHVCGRVSVFLRACLCVRQFVWACVRVLNCVCVLSYVFLYECVLVGGCSCVRVCS